MKPILTNINGVDVVINLTDIDDSLVLEVNYDKDQAKEKNVTKEDLETAIKKVLVLGKL